MGEPRSVVITGASRGLGFASAARLYREGWRVVAAMRRPERDMAALREATGAADDDDRLIPVQLDLLDPESVSAAGKAIEEALGIQVRALGADHPKIAGTCVQLASLYVHQQRYDEADMQLMIAFDYLRDHACEQPDVVDGLKALALKTHQGHGTRADLAAWKTRLQALNCESQAP